MPLTIARQVDDSRGWATTSIASGEGARRHGLTPTRAILAKTPEKCAVWRAVGLPVARVFPLFSGARSSALGVTGGWGKKGNPRRGGHRRSPATLHRSRNSHFRAATRSIQRKQ